MFRNFGDSAINKGQIAYFSFRMREMAIFLLPVKHLTSPSCSPTPISNKMQEFWRFGHKYGPNCIFFIPHARNGLISTYCRKSDAAIVFPDPDFLYNAIILVIREHLRRYCIFHICIDFQDLCVKNGDWFYYLSRAICYSYGKVMEFLVWPSSNFHSIKNVYLTLHCYVKIMNNNNSLVFHH